MKFSKAKVDSILFVCPDYHCSFIYRAEFREKGWKADIALPHDYPEHLLFENTELIRLPSLNVSIKMFSKVQLMIKRLIYELFMVRLALQYDCFVFYGKIAIPLYWSPKFLFGFLGNKKIILYLAFMKALKKKIVFVPPGCNDEFSKIQFSRFDNGNICANCGFEDRCDDKINLQNFEIVRKYFSISINPGFFESPNFPSISMKYKAIDLSRWTPNLNIPKEYLLPKSERLKVLQVTSLETRSSLARNIKGTGAINSAITTLQSEGFAIEFLHLQGIPSKEIIYFQAQADIVIDQLIYGIWGSSGIEAMALGKPVICYLRESWKDRFLREFGYSSLPIIEADTRSIYRVLKSIMNSELDLAEISRESRRFAEQHFNSKTNVADFIKLLQKS